MTAPVAHVVLQGADRAGTRSARVVIVVVFVAAAYVITVVAANWASTHWPPLVLGSLVIPAGTLWAGAVFTVRDLLHEALGAAGVAGAVVVGAGLSWLLASPHISVASVAAFAVSETLDSLLYAMLRRSSRLHAVLGSNLLGLVVDSVVFVPLAFGSFAAVPGQIAGKTAATALAAALLQIAWRHHGRVVPR
ncbi:MAG TPA: VUT family protein [Lentzea sp.]